ncbi:MAG: hypothetical protein Q9227_008331 [Pyrenula ochraceoflavens]
MAQIQADSELMTNLVSAVPVPGGSYFRIILDESRRPLVISISNDPIPQLQLVYVTHKNLDQATSWGSDITRIDVAANGYEYSLARDEETPENVSGIIDIAPASSIYGKGLFVLYKSGGISKLYARFRRLDTDANDGSMATFVTSLKCASDAECIASMFQDTPRGLASGLLVGSSEGVRQVDARNVDEKQNPGTLISANTVSLKSIRSLEIAQDGICSTMWFTNSLDELGYIRTQHGDFSSGLGAMVLPAKQASSFAVCTAQPSDSNGNVAWQMLISVDRQGSLRLLQQASDTGIWRPEPFYMPSNNTNFEVESYTITLKVSGADSLPLTSGRAFVASASSVEATLNGVSCTLTPDGDWYDVDDAGSLDFIVPTQSLGAQSLEITKLVDSQGNKVALPQRFVHDPAMKPMQNMYNKMKSYKDAKELAAAKTGDGSSLFTNTPDSKDLEGAVKCFQTLSDAYAKMPRDGTSTLVRGYKRAEAVAEATNAKVEEVSMDAWHWLKSKIHDAVDWFVDTAGKAWKFVCKLGGKVWQFVLDCAEKICEAATWVWDKIKVGWQKLKDFVGFLFNWSDIKETKNTISALLTAGIGAAGDKVGDVEKKVDGFFDSIVKQIDSLGTSASAKKIAKSSDSQASKSDSSNGTGATWAQERLKNGGATSSTQVDPASKNSESVTTWSSVVQPALDKLQKDVLQVSQDIAQMFKKNGAINGDDVLKVSKSVLKVAVNAIRGLVTSILRLVRKLCDEIVSLGNKAIKIPIFSALWKKISGSDLTIFDAISLIIAIPTTLMAKLTTGKKPPKIEGLDRKLMKRVLDKDPTLDSQVSYDLSVLKAEIGLGLVVSKGIWSLIKIAYKTIKSGLPDAVDKKVAAIGPATFFDMMGISFDMLGSIISLPDQQDLPGAEYRNWISAISFYRGACNLVVFFAGGGEAADKALLVLDVISAIAQFGLYMAVCDAEYSATKWADYDPDVTSVTVMECVMNLLAGVGYSAAAFFKLQQPIVSGVGMIVMQGGLVGLSVVEVAKFKTQYEKNRRARLAAPAL